MSTAEYNRTHRLKQKAKGLCIDCKQPAAPHLRCSSHRRVATCKVNKYKMTSQEYDQLRDAQNDSCAICEERKPLHVDHDHETGRVRGLLCGSCNRAIGLLKDDLARLRAALEYLNG